MVPFVLALAIGGCVEPTDEPGGEVTQPSRSVAASNSESKVRTLDAAFREIGVAAPGFGGMFLDSRGALVLNLTANANVVNVTRAVIRVVGALPGRPSLPVKVQRAEYDVVRLLDWRDAYHRQGMQREVIFSDMNEVRNRIVLGVTDIGVAPQVYATLERLGIPRGAVVVERRALPQGIATLRDSVRPVIGGLLFESKLPNTLPKQCSAGFNANLSGDATGLYLITAAHCTNAMGSVDGDSLFAPSFITYWRSGIAHETTDPSFAAISGCPGGLTCRLSDAVAFKYENASTGQLGLLARTLYSTTGYSGNTLTRDTADFHLTGAVKDSSVMLFGMWVNKVGQRTGWNQGRIDETCATMAPIGMPANTTLLCQYSAWNALGAPDSTYAYPGDSGSPAFFVNGLDLYSEGLAWVAGILHSTGVSSTADANGFTPNGKKTFWFSPFSGVRADLSISRVSSPECEPNAPYWNNCKP